MAGKTFKPYDFTLAAGGSQVILAEGEYFRVQSATGAIDVTVEGAGTLPGLLSGQALKDTPFKRLVLRDASGAPNSGTILVASQEFVDNRLYGVVTLGSAVAIDAPSLSVMRRPLQLTGSYKANGALAGATPDPVFLPADNLNGAIILTASVSDIGGGGSVPASNQLLGFVAKASNPASIVDGDPVFVSGVTAANASYYYCSGQMPNEQFVPPGLGLYFIAANAAVSAYGFRSCRYILL